jgi:hypothetical protein
MFYKLIPGKCYKGPERRNPDERRRLFDRRNLVRFDSFGSDRRLGLPRRREERPAVHG